MRKHIVKIFLQGLGYIISEFGSYNSQITWIRLSLEKSGGQKWRFFTKFQWAVLLNNLQEKINNQVKFNFFKTKII